MYLQGEYSNVNWTRARVADTRRLLVRTGTNAGEKYADIEHAECFHRGDKFCRYIITWEKTPPLILKRVRNYFLLSGILILGVLFFIVPVAIWTLLLLLGALGYQLISTYAAILEKKELTKTIEIQKEAAEERVDAGEDIESVLIDFPEFKDLLYQDLKGKFDGQDY